MPTPAQKSQYLLLLHQPHGGVPPPEELQKIMTRFQAWMENIRNQTTVVSTNGLDPKQGVVLRGPRGQMLTDGPYAESKEVVGGYVLIEAANLEQAVALARECPGLDYNMAVEVRPVLARG